MKKVLFPLEFVLDFEPGIFGVVVFVVAAAAAGVVVVCSVVVVEIGY